VDKGYELLFWFHDHLPHQNLLSNRTDKLQIWIHLFARVWLSLKWYNCHTSPGCTLPSLHFRDWKHDSKGQWLVMQREYMGLRQYYAGNFNKRAYMHIRDNFPFWNRTSGHDHIWVSTRSTHVPVISNYLNFCYFSWEVFHGSGTKLLPQVSATQWCQSIKPGGPEDFWGCENLAIIFVV
jgi:hypothetical protein